MKTKIGVVNSLKKLADDHGPEILCGAAILNLGLMIVCAFRASKNVVEVKAEYEKTVKKAEDEAKAEERELTQVERRNLRINRDVQYVLAYKWVGLFGVLSSGCMIASNKISGSKIAGLTVALAASEDKIKKGLDKFKEKYGEEEFNRLKDDFRKEVLGEQIQNGDCPFSESEINELAPKGMVFFDTFVHSLIEIPETQVREAIDVAEDYICRNHCLNFNKWRGFLGLEDCPAGINFEWNPMCPFNVEIGEMSFGSGKIKTIEYVNMPTVHKL